MSDFYRYYESGVNDERERIIKLLGQTKSPSHLWGGIAWAIALIKGEQIEGKKD